MALAVKVVLEDAQRVRKALMNEGLVDYSFKPKKDEHFFYVPVLDSVKGYTVVDVDLDEKEEQKSLREALVDLLSDEELVLLKTAYDFVGDIAIMEIDESLRGKELVIGETLLGLIPAVKVVVRKDGGHEGELRIQKYKHLAGEERTSTVVTENGVELVIDIGKTYYSVRSGTERKRVAGLVKSGERVLVMFSGAGPFPLVINALSSAKEIIGVELNHEAHALAMKNKNLNHAMRVDFFQGDVREVVPTLGVFDRIVMPLPHTAKDFLDVAVSALRKGGMIHLYHFCSETEINSFRKELPARLRFLKVNGVVEHVQRCGNLAPGVHRWCLDVRVG